MENLLEDLDTHIFIRIPCHDPIPRVALNWHFPLESIGQLAPEAYFLEEHQHVLHIVLTCQDSNHRRHLPINRDFSSSICHGHAQCNSPQALPKRPQITFCSNSTAEMPIHDRVYLAQYLQTRRRPIE